MDSFCILGRIRFGIRSDLPISFRSDRIRIHKIGVFLADAGNTHFFPSYQNGWETIFCFVFFLEVGTVTKKLSVVRISGYRFSLNPIFSVYFIFFANNVSLLQANRSGSHGSDKFLHWRYQVS